MSTLPARSVQCWTLTLATVASFMTALDTLVVATALDTIRQDLAASVAELEWTVNAYNLSFAVLLMTAAAVGDRFGRRRMFAVGLVLFVVASAACAMSGSVTALIAARAAQGVGAALVMTLSLALVSSVYPTERRGAAIGVLEGMVGLAVALGPLVGGAIAEGLDWQWIFWINVPIGLLAFPLVLTRLEESHGPDSSLDLGGLVLVSAGAFGVVWTLVRGNVVGWVSGEALLTLAAGVAALVGFVVWENQVRYPMLPMRFFRARGFSAGNAAVFFTFASLFAAVFFLAQFLQVAQGHGPLDAGIRLLPWTATLFFCAPVAGALVDRVGERPLLVVGLTGQAFGLGWVALVAEPSTPYAALVPPLMIAGLGVSMALPAVQTAVVGAVDHSEIGKAAGANSMMRELGGVFGIAVVVAVFAAVGGYSSPGDFTNGFGPALAVGAGLSLAGAVAALWVPRVGGSRPTSADGMAIPAIPGLAEEPA